MDTKLKKSKGSFIKVLCILLMILLVGSTSFLSISRIEGVRNGGASWTSLRQAINFGSVARMEQVYFNNQLESYQHALFQLSEFEGGTEEKYNELVKEHTSAVKNLKTDIIYHLKSDIYETNRTGGVEGTRGLFELYERGYLSLVPLYSETADIGRYVSYKNEFSHTEMERGDYIENFVDEPDSYYDGSWDDYHKNSGTVDTYYESFPEEIKKLSKEKNCDLTVCMNTLIYSEFYEEEMIEYTTMHPVTNAEGDFQLYDDVPTQYYGFYGVKLNEAKLLTELHEMPYGSYESFRSEYLAYKNKLESFNSAYYAMVMGNKVVSTNIKGITEKSTVNEIRSALSDCGVLMNWIADDWEVEKEQIDVNLYYFDDVPKSMSMYVGIYPYGAEGEKATANTVFAPELTTENKIAVTYYLYALSDINLYVLICVVGYLILLAILIAKSGRRRHDDEIYLSPFDKIWVEVRLLIDAALVWGGALVIYMSFMSLRDNGVFNAIKEVTIVAVLIAMALVLTDFILYLTRNLKNHSLASRFMVVWVFEKLIKGVVNFLKDNKNRLGEKKKALLRRYLYVGDVEIEVRRKLIIVVLINLVVGLFAYLVNSYPGLAVMFILFAFDCYVLLRIMRFTGAVKRLFRVTGEIRKGDENAKVDYTAIPEAFHETADNLMGIRDGIKAAVDKAMQNEKMKTELITNVSHDLKTPLTSIINYVDLLQKCDIEDETAQSYLAVLSEKSDRLKHLIEDLVEASKASSGAINVHTVSVSVTEFINQLVGEHGEGLSEKNLNVIVNLPDEDIVVKADSNLLYRVLENLVVNVKKYAMENTRVYINAQKSGNVGRITIKNISAAPLNMTPEELKSRFVRGDESRSTSGNGLGLSIAENLCNLMKGKLDLSIDGDLFTATVEMPIE